MSQFAHYHTFNDSFFKPLIETLPLSDHQRICHRISDEDFLKMGVHRCLSTALSGHDFLQNYRKDDQQKVAVGHFFSELKSARRLENLTSVNQHLHARFKDTQEDELASIVELENWQIYAGDGHYHKAAVFDPKTKADLSTKEPSKSPVGHFFLLDLRTHHLGYLDLAQPDEGKKQEHDLRLLKRQDLENLRGRAKSGQKTFYLWDRACIDFAFWNKAKHQKGVYFATLAKSNSVTKKIDSFKEIDHQDARNEGLLSDDLVETSQGYEIRRIIYVDPSDGKKYTYLTNEKTLPAWIIVLLYKHRWDIEKVFDETKTKLGEKQAWATSATAKKMQALLLCLAHNLMVLAENEVRQNHGFQDLVEAKKKRTRAKTRKGPTGESRRKKTPPSYINRFFKRATQRTFRFIRWLREHLKKQSSYLDAIDDLAVIWGCKS